MNSFFRPTPLESIDEPEEQKSPTEKPAVSPFSTRYSGENVGAPWELAMSTPTISPDGRGPTDNFSSNVQSDVDSPSKTPTPKLSKPDLLELN